MNKNGKRFFTTSRICQLLILVVLANFFLITAFSDKKEKQMELSVILYYAGAEGWQTLQEGLKQAEDDFSVNINYSILREGEGHVQQMEILQREIDNGAEGIILAAVDAQGVKEALEEADYKVPIVFVESGVDGDLYQCISADDYAMGKRLAELVLSEAEGWHESMNVGIMDEGIERHSVSLRKKGFLDTVEAQASQSLMIQEVSQQCQAVVCLSKEAALSAMGSSGVSNDAKIYAIGNTASIVAALDQGKIERLIFQNEYNAGYVSVKTIVEKRQWAKSEEQRIDFYSVSRQELYGTQYEQLLFPIVE